ncbi:MAG: class I SAM-dependent methyltransferase [Thermotogota bacterium]|nr:class I SAM-dependent methyltransferase [Thermotogota bacterium]
MKNFHREEYQKIIDKEAAYWDNVGRKAVEYGIPVWVDLKRAGLRRKTVPPYVKILQYDPYFHNIVRENMRIIEPIKGKSGRILDIVCGAGWIGMLLAEKGFKVSGLDVSKDMIDIAKRHAQKFSKNLKYAPEYTVMDLNFPGLEKNLYDYVTAFDGLHHILHLDNLLKEIRKAVKDKGELLVYDHVGTGRLTSFINRLGTFLGYLVPSRNHSYPDQIKYLIGKLSGAKEGQGLSPFEDVSADKLIGKVGNYFKIKEIDRHISLFKIMETVYGLYLPRSIREKIIRNLKKIDGLLTRKGILTGEYVFIRATKSDI